MSASRIKVLAFQISYISDDAIEELQKGIGYFYQKNLEKMITHLKQGQEYLEKARTLQLELLQEDIERLSYSSNDFHIVGNFCEAMVLGRYGRFLMEVLEKKRMREDRKKSDVINTNLKQH